jgi:DNA-binding CsgD family transcriptional regulator
MRGLGLLALGGICGFTWARAVIDGRSPTPELSERQTAILALVARGMSTKEIALHEGISAHSVNTHIRRAKRTLGVGTRAAAVAALRGAGQAVTPPRPSRSATRPSATTISPTSSSNGT